MTHYYRYFAIKLMVIMLLCLTTRTHGLAAEAEARKRLEVVGTYETIDLHVNRATEMKAHELDSTTSTVIQPSSNAQSTPLLLLRSDKLFYEDATYISVHFQSFDLPKGDFVVVRSLDSKQAYKYTDFGRGQLGKSKKGFFASHIRGNTAIVEYFSRRSTTSTSRVDPRFGYVIDKYGRGFKSSPFQTGGHETICGNEDYSQESKCFTQDERIPDIATGSMPIARLLTNGQGMCTGWLVGCEGHLITNEHCIGNQDEASNTDFEFMAETASCSEKGHVAMGHAGNVIAQGSTLIAVDQDLDYALVKLNISSNVDVNMEYGYLQVRGEGGPRVGEEIYIPQHPRGFAKKISMQIDGNGTLARVELLNVTNSCGKDQVGYFADTQGGSSGSPVISLKDNSVIALHHCGGCHNTGIQIQYIVQDLIKKGVLPLCATTTTGSINTPPTEYPSLLDTNLIPSFAPRKPIACRFQYGTYPPVCQPTIHCQYNWSSARCEAV